MTAQTSRYGIQYPTGSDLVSNIPQHMQNAANSIEQALADVDDRHTTAAYSPVIRNTKDELDSVNASPGQIGIVKQNNQDAVYWICGVDNYWHRLCSGDVLTYILEPGKNPLTAFSILWKVPYSDSQIRLTRAGQTVTVNGTVKFTGTGQLNHQSVAETMPVGYRPSVDNCVIQFAGNAWPTLFVNKDGKCRMLGNPLSQYASASGSWFTNDPYPTN